MQRKDFDKIERYLAGRMDPDEKDAFERHLSEDTDLALTVEKHRLEHDVMKALLISDLREKSKAWKKESESGGQNRGRNFRLGGLLGILLLTLAAVLFYLNLPGSRSGGEGLQEEVAPALEQPQEPAAPPAREEAQEELDAEAPPVAVKPPEPTPSPETPAQTESDPVLAYDEPVTLDVTRLQQESAGFAGTGQVVESIPVIIRPAEGDPQYRFRDTLTLYLPGNPESLVLRYDAARNLYQLAIDGQTYTIERGYNSRFELEKD